MLISAHRFLTLRASLVTVTLLITVTLWTLGAVGIHAEEGEAETVSFIADVAPIMVRNCEACHGEKTSESNYRLDTFDRLMKAGDFDLAPVTAGDIDESEIVRLILAEDEDERMPNNGKRLSDKEIAAIKNWILQGANFDGQVGSGPLANQLPRQTHPAAPDTYPVAIPVTALAYSEDGTRLFVGGYHEIVVWDPTATSVLARFGNVAERTLGLELSPDGSLLAVAGGAPGVSGEAKILRSDNGEEASFLARYADVCFDIAFRPDGQQVAVASADGSVRVFEASSGKELLKIENHSDWVMDVAWSHDGKRIATASRDKSSKVFEAESGELVASFSGHGAPVTSVAFLADGAQVISGGADKKIRIWKVEDASSVAEVGGFDDEINAIIEGDGQIIAASSDRHARQFKTEDRALLRALSDHPDWVLSLAKHQASQRFCTGCFDGTVTVWNLEDGSQINRFAAVPGND